MKLILLAIIAALAFGCASTAPRREPTPVDPVATTVDNALASSGRASEMADKAFRDGLKAGSIEAKALKDEVGRTKAELEQAKIQVTVLRDSVEKNRENYDMMADKYEQMSKRMAVADSAIWKRNAIIIGLFLVIGGYIVAKFWFRIPFL